MYLVVRQLRAQYVTCIAMIRQAVTKWFWQFLMALFLFWLPIASNAASLEISKVNNAQLIRQFEELASLKGKSIQEVQPILSKAAQSLLTYLAPKIKHLDGFNTTFVINCTVPFDSNDINNIKCDVDFSSIDPGNQADPNALILRENIRKLRHNNIFLTRAFLNCSSGEYLSGANGLYFEQPWDWTKTESQSNIERSRTSLPTISDTKSLSETETASISNTKTSSVSNTALTDSITNASTFSESNKTTGSETMNTTATDSVTKSISGSTTNSCPNITRQITWSADTGLYEDATNQSGRYIIGCGGVVLDTFSGLQWEQASSTQGYNATYANETYCPSRTTGGYTDWRLPTMFELQSLVDYNIPYDIPPGVNLNYFPNTPPEDFWTSNPVAGNASQTWFVMFNYLSGYSRYGTITNTYYVRCIHGSKDILANRYEETVSGIVKDNLTGLEWEKAVTGGYIWSNAKTHCVSQTTGDKTDWRLPTIKELSSLIDLNVAPGGLCMDPIFAGEANSAYWSSTPVSGHSSFAWHVNFSNGDIYHDDVSGKGPVRCVRDNKPLKPNWKADTGLYEDATNQTNRYIAANGVVKDLFSNMQWEQTSSTQGYNATYANETYCPSRTTGGYTDWRLPTVLELQILVDYTISCKTPPGINLIYFPNTPTEDFWASNLLAGNASSAWCTAFHGFFGNIYYRAITNPNYVRCVRSFREPLANRYEISVSGVVRDSLTGLEWEKTVTGTYSWSNAKTHCESQTTGGKTDWRFPTIKELSTLIDYTIAPGGLCMNPIFAEESNGWYLSSTLLSGEPGYAWGVRFSRGSVEDGLTNGGTRIRCVRDNKPLEANWKADTGLYKDATNQTNRYIAANGVVKDLFSNMQWEQKSSPERYNATYANKTYCPSQTTGGYTGWRPPTVLELQMLVDYTIPYNTPPGINLNYFPNSLAVSSWTSDSLAGNASQAWYMDFSDYSGFSYFDPTTKGLYVRCILGSKEIPIERYKISVPGVVKDDLTGLEWEKTVTADMIWAKAKAHCDGQMTGGKDDWRLPTIKELSTLIDRTVAPGSLTMNKIFTGELATLYWSSTGISGDSSAVWTVGFHIGCIDTNDVSLTYRVRCVRDAS